MQEATWTICYLRCTCNSRCSFSHRELSKITSTVSRNTRGNATHFTPTAWLPLRTAPFPMPKCSLNFSKDLRLRISTLTICECLQLLFLNPVSNLDIDTNRSSSRPQGTLQNFFDYSHIGTYSGTNSIISNLNETEAHFSNEDMNHYGIPEVGEQRDPIRSFGNTQVRSDM